MRKFKSLFLAATLIVSLAGGVRGGAVQAESSIESPAAEITLGGAVQLEINKSDYEYVSFTPKESGAYTFYSTTENEDTDPMASLCINESEDIAFGDDSYSDLNFCINCTLEKGKTYYLVVKACEYEDKDAGGKITIYCKNYSVDMSNAELVNCEVKGNNIPTDFSWVVLSDGVTEYVPGIDYSIVGTCTEKEYSKEKPTWTKGMPTEPGDYKIRINGLGDYSDIQLDLYFYIPQPFADINNISYQTYKEPLDVELQECKKNDEGDLETPDCLFLLRTKNTGYYNILIEVLDEVKEGEEPYLGFALLDKNGYELDGFGSCGLSTNCDVLLEEGVTYYLDVYSDLLKKLNVRVSVNGLDDVKYEYVESEESDPTPTPTKAPEPTVTPTVTPTEAPTNDPTGTPTQPSDQQTNPSAPSVPAQQPVQAPTQAAADAALSVGSKFVSGNYSYVVTSAKAGAAEVKLSKNNNKKMKKATVPATVTYNGISYKVTAIGSGAFKENKKLTSVTIGANVKTIEKEAFSGASKLGKVKINSKSIKKIGVNAFKGIKKKATISVPKAKKSEYKKLLKKAKLAKSVKVK